MSVVGCFFMITAVKQAIGDTFLERKAMAVRNFWDFDLDCGHLSSPVHSPPFGPHPWL